MIVFLCAHVRISISTYWQAWLLTYRIGLHQVTPLGVMFLFMLVNWWVEKHQRFYSTFTNVEYFFTFFTFLTFFYFLWNVFFTSMTYSLVHTLTHLLTTLQSHQHHISLRFNGHFQMDLHRYGTYSLAKANALEQVSRPEGLRRRGGWWGTASPRPTHQLEVLGSAVCFPIAGSCRVGR